MGRRRRSRELALQILFQVEITRDPPAQVLEHFWADHPGSPGTRGFAEELVLGVLQHLGEIDGIIAGAAEHWRLERMAIVDRNVLRSAIFELTRRPETPAAVVIDEAIEVARKFGSQESAPFINGVLDGIRLRIEKARAGT
jgi:N utilization substance protein B